VAQRTTPRSESFALYRFISPKIHGTVAVRWHADDRGRRFATPDEPTSAGDEVRAPKGGGMIGETQTQPVCPARQTRLW